MPENDKKPQKSILNNVDHFAVIVTFYRATFYDSSLKICVVASGSIISYHDSMVF